MAEALRKRLPLGYDEDFVDEVEGDFECLICHLPLKEPVQTRCGHRFCTECLEENFRSQRVRGSFLTCPADRRVLDRDRDVFPDKATERKILSFAVKCPSEGCEWTGELRIKEHHLTSCPYALVPWTNGICDVRVQRRMLTRHVMTACQWKFIKCVHCREPHPKCQMKDHLGQCAKYPLLCPNKCGLLIPREKIPDHTANDCPLSLISCPYEQIGCKKKVQRQEMESHLESDMKPHLDLACVKLETRTFIWKIERFSEVLRRAKAWENPSMDSSPFYTDRTDSYGYKLKVRVAPNGDGTYENTHLSVYIVVMKGEYDAMLPWPFKRKVRFTLIDQQEDLVERQNITQHFTPGNHPESFARPKSEDSNQGFGFAQFVSHEALHSRRYIVDDTLFLQVDIGPSSS